MNGNSIKDVARVAGVGVSTVSRVINGSGYVKASTKKKILHTMQELNFQPSSLARGLVLGSTTTIGLLIPDVANPFFSEIARGVEDAARVEGYSVFLCNSDWQHDRETNYLKLLQSHWVAGVIVVGSRSSREELMTALEDLPYVLVDRQSSLVESHSVFMNNEAGAYFATRHLIEQGCIRIVHIAGPQGSPSAQQRLLGYSRAIQEANLPEWIENGDFKYGSGYDVGMRILTSGNRPNGIFAGNDMMAIGVMQAASKIGIKIPDELKMVGFDNTPMSAFVFPSLSTINQPSYEMGKMAFKMLNNQLSADMVDSSEQAFYEFSPELIVRSSTIQ